MRIVICGAPKCGKTTLARLLASEHGIPVVSTDDYQREPWSEIPDLVIRDLANQDAFILEGVQAGRVLRRWFNSPGGAPPIAFVYWLEKPIVPRSEGQETLAKGVATVFANVRPLLQKKGVPIFPGHPMLTEARKKHAHLSPS